MRKHKSNTTMRLIKTAVEALPLPASGQAVYWDEDLTGFGIRISDRGTRTYFVQGRLPDGRQVKVKVGRHSAAFSAEKARAKAKAMLGAMAAGTDPAAERRAARKAETERRSAPTMADLCARYLAEHAPGRLPGDATQACVLLASKMVGRWPSGAPLVKSPDADDLKLADFNDFLFVRSGDADGRAAHASSTRRVASSSATGRTSTDPIRAPGICASAVFWMSGNRFTCCHQ